jgi:hypothetical protein
MLDVVLRGGSEKLTWWRGQQVKAEGWYIVGKESLGGSIEHSGALKCE